MKPINPSKLYDLTDEQRSIVINLLDELHTNMLEDAERDPDPATGLEFVLEALGAEGYEFT